MMDEVGRACSRELVKVCAMTVMLDGLLEMTKSQPSFPCTSRGKLTCLGAYAKLTRVHWLYIRHWYH